jgi:hypothetical protein
MQDENPVNACCAGSLAAAPALVDDFAAPLADDSPGAVLGLAVLAEVLCVESACGPDAAEEELLPALPQARSTALRLTASNAVIATLAALTTLVRIVRLLR